MATAAFDAQDENVVGESNAVYYQNQETYDADYSSSVAQNKSSDCIPDEECWLFKPPKSSNPISPKTPCLIWLREVFDSPSSQFYQRRKDLLHRLEVILATEPFKKLPNLGGSVPSLNTSTNDNGNAFSKSRIMGGGSNQNFGPGSSATFVRPKRHVSDVLPPQQQQQPQHGSGQHSRQRSSPIPFKPGTSPGSTDDLQNIDDLRNIARKQEDELKAEVAAISAHHHANRSSGSQQSLNRSGPESPYNSQPRLNISSSPTPSDIAKQQMAALRLSLDSQRHGSSSILAPHRLGSTGSDENLTVGGEASITSPGLEPQFPEPLLPSLGTQQAVIVGRPVNKPLGSRLPAPMMAVRRNPRFPSNETLPSFGLGDGTSNLPMRRSSQEHLNPPRSRIPMPPPRITPSYSYQSQQ